MTTILFIVSLILNLLLSGALWYHYYGIHGPMRKFISSFTTQYCCGMCIIKKNVYHSIHPSRHEYLLTIKYEDKYTPPKDISYDNEKDRNKAYEMFRELHLTG